MAKGEHGPAGWKWCKATFWILTPSPPGIHSLVDTGIAELPVKAAARAMTHNVPNAGDFRAPLLVSQETAFEPERLALRERLRRSSQASSNSGGRETNNSR
jgi:hypothetical protein